MITCFFGKVSVAGSKGGRTGPEIEECPKGESTLSTDLTKSYLEKIDQFIQIINGNESSRDYVVTLLEKAQGDINKALDIYYSNPDVKHDENTENMVVSNKSAQFPCCTNDSPVSKNKHAPEEPTCIAYLSLRGQPVEHVSLLLSTSLLALSPEDVLPAVYLCTHKIITDHENIELNISGSLVTSALEEACGTNRSKIRDMHNDMGDLGRSR
ncbi:hypothetical protein F3Y22_tig00112281pilonHSYRG00191 [Hibiscus syriacus]|uniref:DNA ligase ATP-dependent N-terminal domain-containing protein n=1 Tax=Hibiscus syriacus TaxID=106335 RepID=A0A6A2X261_HIBSY|nr:hypothetical protein F3Y22_tig00112281pilonHSYRG00191 [Hibiscus syriacus]